MDNAWNHGYYTMNNLKGSVYGTIASSSIRHNSYFMYGITHADMHTAIVMRAENLIDNSEFN